MKNMQDFHKWLCAFEGAFTVHQRRLKALTHFDRTRLIKATDEGTWFIWAAEAVSAVS
ncbi:MAG TPA: hypothetical protein PLF42_01105 [Anaerolineales bacterium]|nr:hypothetical protein [Anaerolineales bacterium]